MRVFSQPACWAARGWADDPLETLHSDDANVAGNAFDRLVATCVQCQICSRAHESQCALQPHAEELGDFGFTYMFEPEGRAAAAAWPWVARRFLAATGRSVGYGALPFVKPTTGQELNALAARRCRDSNSQEEFYADFLARRSLGNHIHWADEWLASAGEPTRKGERRRLRSFLSRQVIWAYLDFWERQQRRKGREVVMSDLLPADEDGADGEEALQALGAVVLDAAILMGMQDMAERLLYYVTQCPPPRREDYSKDSSHDAALRRWRRKIAVMLLARDVLLSSVPAVEAHGAEAVFRALGLEPPPCADHCLKQVLRSHSGREGQLLCERTDEALALAARLWLGESLEQARLSLFMDDEVLERARKALCNILTADLKAIEGGS